MYILFYAYCKISIGTAVIRIGLDKPTANLFSRATKECEIVTAPKIGFWVLPRQGCSNKCQTSCQEQK